MVHPLRQVFDGEPVRRKPSVEHGRFLRPHFVLESAAEEPIAEHEAGIRGEDEIGQPRLRSEGFDGDPSLTSVSRRAFHWRNATARTAPSDRFIQGLISYSMP